MGLASRDGNTVRSLTLFQDESADEVNRMATDLNLHRKSVMSGLDTDEGRARDLEVIINRERCWLHCFVLDRSLSAQMGKPYTIREDYIIRHACEASWHKQRFSLASDIALAAYVVLQQTMSRTIDLIYSSTSTISGLRQDCDCALLLGQTVVANSCRYDHCAFCSRGASKVASRGQCSALPLLAVVMIDISQWSKPDA